ncbi:MAG: TrmH family RNA methyltransferase [Streptosporangiaceae bacterium]
MRALQQIGLRHTRIREVRRIASGAGQDRRLILAEGLWAHEVLVGLDAAIEMFLWCPEAAYSAEARALGTQVAARARCAYRIAPAVLDRLCERERPDGMLSLVRLPAWDADRIELNSEALVLVADAIEIPGNLGTLLRTLDACGGDCLIVTSRRTRLNHPKVFRGSRGTNLRVPVIEFAEPADAAAWLRERDFGIFLATVSTGATPYQQASYWRRTALVVGNERNGITQPWFSHASGEITIPMVGRADSLNVAVSASILMYDIQSVLSGAARARASDRRRVGVPLVDGRQLAL